MGTNCLGAFLFTQCLTPLLQKTAASSPKGSVRVTWAASLATIGSPKDGVAFDSTTQSPKVHGVPGVDYAQSKAGNVLLAQEYQKRHADDGIVSNAWNPGNLDSELMRYYPNWFRTIFRWVLLYPSIYGAYTELWAGWAEEAGREEAKGKYVVPWGRVGKLRGDVENSANADKFWGWCEKETKGYAS
jgi:NAD(P)-dependent dehydrogenase (short-subunit alcohol dehydrogenase family)